MPSANIDANYILPEVVYRRLDWQLIEDCLAGERAIKLRDFSHMNSQSTNTNDVYIPGSNSNTIRARGTTYLPVPNPDDLSLENVKRYQQYVMRAVFYNVAKRTHSGLTSLAFVDKPVIELPPGLQLLLDDVNGAGLTLEQQLREILDGVAAHGRFGLFVDFPPVEKPVSQSEIAGSTTLRPIIRTYKPWDIINWDEVVVGARKVPSLVVLAERYTQRADDGFSVEVGNQWRVLRLTQAGYTVTVYKEAVGEGTNSETTYLPRDKAGKPLTEIPFIACGATNNDLCIDDPPMLDICTMNIAHYRNSADYEESVFMCGQPTPTLTGMTKDWWENVLNKTVRFGSRSAVPLPPNSELKLVQAEPNGLVREAMQDKERQMVALGARLIQTKQVQRTATEAKIETASEMSILTACASNVSAAYTKCMQWAGLFAGVAEPSTIELHPNSELERLTTTDERAALIADLQVGTLSFTEVRDSLRSAGLATEDDEEVKAAKDVKDAATAKAAKEALAAKVDNKGTMPVGSPVVP
jgi:hypothetical protein